VQLARATGRKGLEKLLDSYTLRIGRADCVPD